MCLYVLVRGREREPLFGPFVTLVCSLVSILYSFPSLSKINEEEAWWTDPVVQDYYLLHEKARKKHQRRKIPATASRRNQALKMVCDGPKPRQLPG